MRQYLMKLISKPKFLSWPILILLPSLNIYFQMGSSYWMQRAPVSMLKMMPLAQRLVQPVCPFKWKPFNVSKYNGYKLSLKQKPTKLRGRHHAIFATAGQLQPLDLTEENVNQVLVEAKSEFMQLFDPAVGITGVVELAELDGPFVKLRLKGRFWHERSTVLARLGTYLQKRIPEILEVDIEDEAQLDDSPANF